MKAIQPRLDPKINKLKEEILEKVTNIICNFEQNSWGDNIKEWDIVTNTLGVLNYDIEQNDITNIKEHDMTLEDLRRSRNAINRKISILKKESLNN